MTQTHKINEQTQGPAKVDPALPNVLHVRGSTVAEIALTFGLQRAIADARVYAAGYTMLDKAGRALGVDAGELGSSIDLAALISAALEVEKSGYYVTVETGIGTYEEASPAALALRAELAKLPKPV